MAEAIGPFRVKGSMGNIRTYYDRTLKKWISSTKGGANKNLIYNNPSFELTRDLNREWKGCAVWSKIVREGVDPINHLMQGRNNCYLMKIAEKIKILDFESEFGFRKITTSKHKSPLVGYCFSNLHPFKEVFLDEPELTLTDDRSEVTLALNNFLSQKRFSWPEKNNYYRIYLNISLVPDLEWSASEKNYKPVYQPFDPMATASVSNWMRMNTVLTDIRMVAKFENDFVPDDRSIVVVSMGLEFASTMLNGTPYIVKDCGTTVVLGCF